MVLLYSVLIAIATGILLVRTHNRQARKRDYTESTYIGRVRCRVVGKKPVKRNYSDRLEKIRRAKKLHMATVCTLATLCLVTGLFNALPYINNYKSGVANEPLISAATAVKPDSRTLENSEFWQFTEKGVRDITATLKADSYQNGSDGWYRPQLTLNCIGNKTSLDFRTREALGTESAKLTVSFDNVSVTEFNWSTSKDYQAAHVTHAIALARQIAKAHRLKIAYTPFGTSESKIATFNLGASAAAVKKVRGKCAW